MIEDRINRKKQEQKNQKESANSGFSLMNAFNIWGNKKEEDLGVVMVEKEETELKVKKTEIDSVLAAECLYCGPGIVDTITMPFDNEALRNSWKI